MSNPNKENPFPYLFKQFSSLEFKEHETIKSLIRNYYPLNKEEEILIKDISINNKNEFISQIKKVFHELSISMETIEYIFNEYYHFITNNKENPFLQLQKSEVINKLGISSNMYNKILNLYNNIINNLKNNKEYNINNQMLIENDDNYDNNYDNNKKNGNEKNAKKNLENKIENINILSNELKDIISEYKNKDKDRDRDKDKNKNNKNSIEGIMNAEPIILKPEEEEALRRKLETFENCL